MILQKFQLIYLLLPLFLVAWGLIWFYYKRSHSYVREYWFLKTSLSSKFSHLFLIISFVFLLIALLDLRGEEEKINAKVPDQKTIILIDSSASMLAEDVRPNRFLKAIQIARHFVKNSAANQFSVFIFADTFQRILPFTDDIDLVDSRLAALESLATVKGSSNIGYTIKGMIPYFQSEESDVAPVGNILVLTDGEDHEKNEKISLPEGISLAVIGVGTQKGGQIPLRWTDGSFKGFKLSSGSPVVTRLNENYIKSLGKDVTDFNYWIVNSFNLPTFEVAEFFKAKFTAGGKVGEVRSRKAYGEYPMALFVIFYILSLIFSQFKSFKVLASILGLLVTLSVVDTRAAEEERKISDETLKSLEKIRDGEANKSEVLKTAEKLLAEGFPETAKKLYEEHRAGNESVEVENNYAASLVQSKNTAQGIELFKKILERKDLTDEQAQAVRKNLLTAIQKQKSDQNSKSQNDQNKSEQEQQQDGNKSQSGNDSKDGEGKGQGKDQENQQNKQDKKDKSSQNNSNGKQGKGSDEERDLRDLMNKKNQEKNSGGKEQPKDSKEDQKGKEDKKDKKEKKENQGNTEQKKEQKSEEGSGEEPESFEEREKRLKQQKRMKKTPAILKQTLDLDRELQKKFLDASKEKSDNDPAGSRPSKDW